MLLNSKKEFTITQMNLKHIMQSQEYILCQFNPR